MENLKVKEVGAVEQKSVQEVEQELLDKHAKEVEGSDEGLKKEEIKEKKEDGKQKEDIVLKDEDILKYLKEKHDKEFNSFEDIFKKEVVKEALPEDVEAYLKYKKDTNRGFDDYMSLNKDYGNVSSDQLLRDYYSETESDLDSEDVEYILSDKFSYDESLDEDFEIQSKKIAKKREIAKAKKYFNDLKETYGVPVESTKELVSEEERESYNAYKQYVQESQDVQEKNVKRSEYFQEKTNDVFNDDFKGFEFAIGENKVMFTPGDTANVKEAQSDVNNFISKFLDRDGLISDASGYHRALAAAMNPEKMANFFYEKGKSDAIGDVSKKSKNINMDIRSTPQSISNSGFKVSSVDSDSGRGLRIKSRNKN